MALALFIFRFYIWTCVNPSLNQVNYLGWAILEFIYLSSDTFATFYFWYYFGIVTFYFWFLKLQTRAYLFAPPEEDPSYYFMLNVFIMTASLRTVAIILRYAKQSTFDLFFIDW